MTKYQKRWVEDVTLRVMQRLFKTPRPARRYVCSVCHQSGHSKRSCVFAKVKED